jgi:hypothetical protein
MTVASGALGLLGSLTKGLWEKLFDLLAGFLGVKYATRMTAVLLLASIYLACVATFTVMIAPWFAAIVSTGFGALLGLLFPPISGTIVASLMVYRMCVVGVKYTTRLIKMAVG